MPKGVRGESVPPVPAVRGPAHEPSEAETRAAYDAVHAGAMVIDRSARTRAVVTGSGRIEVLNGLLTNDVAALGPGAGQYAALLTPKGKIIADVRIFARPDDLLVDLAARAAAGWWGTIRKYVNPRQARCEDVSDAVHDIGLFGPRAARLLREVIGPDEETWAELPPYGHREAGDGVVVARVPELDVPGFELFAPPDAAARLAHRLRDAGAVRGSDEAWEVSRVEAGRPEWGVDMDDTTLVQEANLDAWHAVSYTKGCYTGQETVARVHFRGHVNRLLRGLMFAGVTPPPFGAKVVDEAGAPVGDVRSVVRSPRMGVIALAMVRREVAPDSEVRVEWETGRDTARVVPLPFRAPP